MMLIRLCFLFIFCSNVATYTINYFFYEDNNQTKNQCITNAIQRISKETCLDLQFNPSDYNALLFFESGLCGFQKADSIVHIGPNCTQSNSDCLELMYYVLTGKRNSHKEIIPRLNIKFDCDDKCTTVCENGGTLTNNCTCICAYGFEGEDCKHEKFKKFYTESSCGMINVDSNGIINLESEAIRNTLCQWFVKTDENYKTFEFEFLEFELDKNDSPLSSCGDNFFVYGVYGISNPIPCGRNTYNSDNISTLVGKKFYSNSSLVTFELRGTPFAEPKRKISLKLTKKDEIIYNDEFPSDKYVRATTSFNGELSIHHQSYFLSVIFSSIFLFTFSFIFVSTF